MLAAGTPHPAVPATFSRGEKVSTLHLIGNVYARPPGLYSRTWPSP